MTINNIASILTKVCPDDILASLLNCLLSCGDAEDATDDEADAGESLFDELMVLLPESTVELAQSL